jgi:hypothetical protein
MQWSDPRVGVSACLVGCCGLVNVLRSFSVQGSFSMLKMFEEKLGMVRV